MATTYTVWVCQANGHGTHHVSSHRAATPKAAAEMALDETCADWGIGWHPEDLHVLGICKGNVQIISWDEGVFGDG